LRVAPDVNVRVATEKSAAEESHTIRIVSARHAARPPSASILNLALPHYRTAPARIPVTTGAAWYLTAHSSATSDSNESLHPEIELQHVAINQPINQRERSNNSWHPAAETNQFEPMPLAESNAIPIGLAPHAHRPLESRPRVAPLTPRAGSHPSHERCGMVSHGVFVRNIRHE
jgi:hypothetical protein